MDAQIEFVTKMTATDCGLSSSAAEFAEAVQISSPFTASCYPHTHKHTQHKQNFANVHIKLAKLQIVFYFTQHAKECERREVKKKRRKLQSEREWRDIYALPSFLRGLLGDMLSCGRCLAYAAVLSLPAASLSCCQYYKGLGEGR